MKTIPFNESARDVWHDASVEVPDDTRAVLVVSHQRMGTSFFRVEWSGVRPHYWRELPAPPKPTPKIVPHSLEHWHDPKVERPESGRRIMFAYLDGVTGLCNYSDVLPWHAIGGWAYCPENAR